VYDIVVKKFTFAILSCDEFLVFINENIFAVATPTNPQNDRVYAPAAMTKERRHAERVSTGLHGDRSVADVVSRTIKIRLYTSLICVDFTVKVIRGLTCCFFQQLLHAIRQISGAFLHFQLNYAYD